MVTMVLRVFVDAYPHIPEHRKLMIFTTLLHVAGIEHYMWRLLLVFIEGVAVQTKTSIAEPATEKEKVCGGGGGGGGVGPWLLICFFLCLFVFWGGWGNSGEKR